MMHDAEYEGHEVQALLIEQLPTGHRIFARFRYYSVFCKYEYTLYVTYIDWYYGVRWYAA